MVVKRMKRRPLFPMLMALLFLAGTGLAVFLEAGIAQNKQAVEDLYASTEVVYRILPGANGSNTLKVSPVIDKAIESAPESTAISRGMDCPVALSGKGLFTFSWVSAVSGIEEFIARHDLEAEWGSGYSAADFAEEGRRICLMEKSLAEDFGLEPGETITIAGCLAEYQLDPEKAAYVDFELAGVYTCEGTTAPTGTVLVPEPCFYEYDGILYNTSMRQQWQVWTYYSFALKNEYNRDFLKFQTKLLDTMNALGSYSLYGTTRELENSVVMLERRVQTMETLQPPILLSILLGTVVVTIFDSMGRKSELLIRLVFGESKKKVLLSEWLILIGQLLLTAVPGAVAMGVLYGLKREVAMAGQLLAVELCMCSVISLLVLTVSLRGSLVQLYQKSKGD